MKQKTTVIIATISIAVIGISVVAKSAAKNRVSDNLPQPDIISVSTPQLHTFIKRCHWFGKVISFDKTDIIALEAGQIIAVNVADDTQVHQGSSLFDIGGSLLSSQIDALQKQVVILDERIKLAEQLTSLKRDAVAQHLAQQYELIAAKDSLAQLKLDKADLLQSVGRLNQASHMTAAGSGVFTDRKVAVGQQVQKGDKLATIISPEHIYIEAALFTESSQKLLQKTVFIKAGNGKEIRGIISGVKPQKTASGATIIRIESKGMQSLFRPGETVSGSAVLSEHKKALAVPQSSIVRGEDERPYLFVQNQAGYRKQPVITGCREHNWIEIITGLNAADKVVTHGAYELFYRNFNKIYKMED
jgi:cobalt-zinc-cadmium efflux system membrane fusion protein